MNAMGYDEIIIGTDVVIKYFDCLIILLYIIKYLSKNIEST